MNENECKSGLHLDALYFSHIECEREQIIAKTALNVNYEVKHKIEGNTAEVEIKTTIKAQNNALALCLKMVGKFTLIDELQSFNEQTKQEVLRLSTVSIMMPYIRSQVSLITTQPDLTPIILQPVDVTRLMSQQQAQE